MSHCAAHGREAYTLGSWQSSSGRSRRGFAEVAQALGDGFEIFPFFCENGEEMRFAPLIELWMLLRLDWGCALLLGCFGLRTNAQVHRLLQQATFWVSLISFPVPVRVTQHIGAGGARGEGQGFAAKADRRAARAPAPELRQSAVRHMGSCACAVGDPCPWYRSRVGLGATDACWHRLFEIDSGPGGLRNAIFLRYKRKHAFVSS
jgi:hypothetical protein